jgi:hypothetical protein
LPNIMPHFWQGCCFLSGLGAAGGSGCFFVILAYNVKRFRCLPPPNLSNWALSTTSMRPYCHFNSWAYHSSTT